ncbi:MAG TPA: secretin N-terminal domain-containing protein [Thermoanaerobaculia bacterium]|nr:secretin N-terminal domain-containing protein [Thermoanaerobaculia bacterium]
MLLAGAQPLLAQPQQQPVELVVHVYTLRYQTAGDALGLVQPLLSPRGTVELRPAANTLVLRDTPEALARLLRMLVAFDHPSRPVDVELWMVRASGKVSSPPLPPRQSAVPAELLRALAEHLPYEQYGLLGSSKVRGAEGEKMTFQVAGDYAVRFRLGTIVGEQRLRLNDFEVLLMPDNGEPVPLLRSQLNLWLGRSMVFALSPGEGSSTALMVVVRCRTVPAQAAAVHATPRPKGGG